MTEQTDDRVRALTADLAPEGADRRVMVCPVCGYENLQGDDLCANCGADLATSDLPQATSPFERLLVEVPLKSLKMRPNPGRGPLLALACPRAALGVPGGASGRVRSRFSLGFGGYVSGMTKSLNAVISLSEEGYRIFLEEGFNGGSERITVRDSASARSSVSFPSGHRRLTGRAITPLPRWPGPAG